MRVQQLRQAWPTQAINQMAALYFCKRHRWSCMLCIPIYFEDRKSPLSWQIVACIMYLHIFIHLSITTRCFNSTWYKTNTIVQAKARKLWIKIMARSTNDYHLCNISLHSPILLQSILWITMLKSTSSLYKYHVFF